MPKLSFFFLLLLFPFFAFCQEEPKSSVQSFRPPKEKPLIRKNGDITLGKISLYKKTKEIRFPAKVTVRSGVLEFLISSYRGSLHESLLVADISPYQLQIMLYLLGADNKKKAKMKGKRGTLINVDIEWQNDGQKKRMAIENLIKDSRTDFVMSRKGFYFVGTSFVNNIPQAEGSGNIACLYSRVDTVLDVADKDSHLDTIFYANTDFYSPGPNQEVTVILSIREEK